MRCCRACWGQKHSPQNGSRAHRPALVPEHGAPTHPDPSHALVPQDGRATGPAPPHRKVRPWITGSTDQGVFSAPPFRQQVLKGYCLPIPPQVPPHLSQPPEPPKFSDREEGSGGIRLASEERESLQGGVGGPGSRCLSADVQPRCQGPQMPSTAESKEAVRGRGSVWATLELDHGGHTATQRTGPGEGSGKQLANCQVLSVLDLLYPRGTPLEARPRSLVRSFIHPACAAGAPLGFSPVPDEGVRP